MTLSVYTVEQGRYVVPVLPKASYSSWVRGYGLSDSPKVKATPGNIVNLTAVAAPNEAAAAQYYPSIYWYSMMKIPDKSEFGGKGKIPEKLTQNEYLNLMKSNGCANCHAIGNRSMRTFPTNVPFPFGKFANSEELWFRRIQSGQGGVPMFATAVKEMGGAPFRYLADWTERIAKGELPHAKPPRPQGVERNIVVTTWDWLDEKHYLHGMFDRKGRVWFAAAVRGPNNPAFCKKGSDHPSAKAFPVERTNRHLTMLDPKTMKYTFIDTCFGTHHLQFDANDVLWTSGGGQVVGWFDMKKFDETGDAAKAQGWTPMILDTNGNGKRDPYVEPNQPVDPTKDKRISAGFYAVMPSPADGSVWGSVRTFPGAVVRIAPGSNPSETALAEIYNVPLPSFGIRGADIDKQGVV